MRVVAKITSGLGNQMFQYACGLHVAKVLDTTLALDTSWFDYFQRHSVKRAFRLAALSISSRAEFSPGPLRPIVGLLGHNHPAIRKFADPVLALAGLTVRSERIPYMFQADVVSPPRPGNSLLLSGYWQTSDHFLAISKELREEFQPARPISGGARVWMEKIQKASSVFIHVRRGDYANFSSAMLSPAYYRRAAGRVAEAGIPSPSWFIFSEDPGWCRENLGFLERANFVEYESADRDIEDIALMATCQAGIMANSSFSWWAAALGSENRLICCPKYWWGTPASNYSALRLPGWIPVEEL